MSLFYESDDDYPRRISHLDLAGDYHMQGLTQLSLGIGSCWKEEACEIIKHINTSTLKEIVIEADDFSVTLPFVNECDNIEKLTLNCEMVYPDHVPVAGVVTVPCIVIDSVQAFRKFLPLFSNTVTSLKISNSSFMDDITRPGQANLPQLALPIFPSLVSASVLWDSKAVIKLIPELVSASPNIITLSCPTWTPDIDPLLLALSQFLEQHRAEVPSTESVSIDAAQPLPLQSLTLEGDPSKSKLGPKYIRTILDNQPSLIVSLNVSKFSRPGRKYPKYNSLVEDYRGRFDLVWK